MKRHLVETAEGALHFRSTGNLDSGRVVLFFHQSPSSSRMWTGVMEALDQRGVASLAGDMFDYGMSDRATHQLTVDTHAGLIFEAAASLAGGAVVVVGHHTGAVFAAAAAARRQVAGLMVVGYPLYSTWREKYERLGARIGPDRYGQDGSELSDLWVKLNSSIEPETGFADRHTILVDRLAAGPLWYTAYAALLGADLEATLRTAAGTNVPIAAVFAHEDAISRFEPGVSEITGTDPIWIDGGPWVTIEHPARVADAVADFLEGLE
jgi:pimeloyl-ACP methyl ester carboxylesterase